MTRDPLTIRGITKRLPSLRETLKKAMNRPRIGVTQGGSSRKFAGARPAATRGEARPEPIELDEDYYGRK